MFRLVPLALLALLALPGPAAAEVQHCRAEVNGEEVIVDYEPGDGAEFTVSRREAIAGAPARIWNRAWGEPPVCNSAVLIAWLGETLAADEIEGYCLEPSETSGYLLVPGERNFRGRCAVTTCERVNATAQEATNLGSFIAGTVLGTNDTGSTLRAITHSSGAAYLTGQSSALSGALSTAGSTAASAAASPAVLGATAASVVVLGGAVWMCSD